MEKVYDADAQACIYPKDSETQRQQQQPLVILGGQSGGVLPLGSFEYRDGQHCLGSELFIHDTGEGCDTATYTTLMGEVDNSCVSEGSMALTNQNFASYLPEGCNNPDLGMDVGNYQLTVGLRICDDYQACSYKSMDVMVRPDHPTIIEKWCRFMATSGLAYNPTTSSWVVPDTEYQGYITLNTIPAIAEKCSCSAWRTLIAERSAKVEEKFCVVARD